MFLLLLLKTTRTDIGITKNQNQYCFYFPNTNSLPDRNSPLVFTMPTAQTSTYSRFHSRDAARPRPVSALPPSHRSPPSALHLAGTHKLLFSSKVNLPFEMTPHRTCLPSCGWPQRSLGNFWVMRNTLGAHSPRSC